MLLAEATFVVTDTETTGVRPEEDRLIELAAVKVRGGEVVARFEQLVDPGCHVPARITQITGISTAMLVGQPPPEEVLPAFRAFLGEAVLVAHNLPFDYRFLQAELARAGLEPLANRGLCTLRLARRLLPSLASHGLSALAQHFGLRNAARHRALGDAEVTARVLLRFLERLRAAHGLRTVEDVLAFQHRRYRDASGEPRHVQRIRREVLPRLPGRPGVYVFRRANGEVLYVGKAKNLADRVRSYFAGIDAHPPRLRRLVRDVRVVEWEETGSELAALLAESHRIKTLMPRDNRAQRRYRDYPFLRLGLTEPYPALTWVPCIRPDGAAYYGPLGSRADAEELTDLLGRHTALRKCDEAAFAAARARRSSCLYHDLGQCLAPCLGRSDAAYAAEVARVRDLLEGDGTDVLRAVEAAMREAAARLDFEEAGLLRDRLARLQRLLARQRPFGASVTVLHAALVEADARGGVQVFLLRGGRLVERLDLPDPRGEADAARLSAALVRHFGSGNGPPRGLDRREVDEMRLLAQWVCRHEPDGRIVRWQEGEGLDAFEVAVRAAVARTLRAQAAVQGDGATGEEAV